MVWREDSKPLDHEEFWDKFTEFVEANGWLTGGASVIEDLNSEEDYPRVGDVKEYQGRHRKVQKE